MITVTGTDLSMAISFLMSGEPVAIPTETVYGLAANAKDEAAVRRVFSAKGRPLSNPLIVHVPDANAMAAYVTEIPLLAQKLLKQFAPGPLTVLLRSNGTLLDIVNGGRPLLAFRVPAHPLTHALLAQLPFPLVAPSANKFTSVSPTEPAHVLQQFNGVIPYILDGGPCRVGIESTVVGFEGDEVLLYRQGAITQQMLENVVGPVRQANREAGASPGQMAHHYSPSTPLYLVDESWTPSNGINTERTGLLRFRSLHPAFPASNQVVLSADGNLEEAAQNLYRALYRLDALSLEAIYAERLPTDGLGPALNDRLQRAAHQPDKL